MNEDNMEIDEEPCKPSITPTRTKKTVRFDLSHNESFVARLRRKRSLIGRLFRLATKPRNVPKIICRKPSQRENLCNLDCSCHLCGRSRRVLQDQQMLQQWSKEHDLSQQHGDFANNSQSITDLTDIVSGMSITAEQQTIPQDRTGGIEFFANRDHNYAQQDMPMDVTGADSAPTLEDS